MSGALAAAGTALLAAGLLGVSSVAQRRGMTVPADPDNAARGLVRSLIASRWWWAGTLASVGGLVLQFLALGMGSLVLVQTTMVSSIAATTLAEWLLLGRRPGRRGWAGMALTATGLVGVLWALAPTAASASTPSAAVTVAIGAVGVAAVTAAALRARATAGGGLALAAATGLGYGITAVALKTVGAQLTQGWSAPLAHPALWVAATLGPVSVLLSQHALHRARRVATAVSLIVVVDPLVGLAAGAAWFGEQVSTAPTALAVAATAAGAVVAGIVVGRSGPAARPAVDPATGSTEPSPGGLPQTTGPSQLTRPRPPRPRERRRRRPRRVGRGAPRGVRTATGGPAVDRPGRRTM